MGNPYDSIKLSDLLHRRHFDRDLHRTHVERELRKHLWLMRSSFRKSSRFRSYVPLEDLEKAAELEQWPAMIRLVNRAQQSDRHAMSLQWEFRLRLNLLCSFALAFFLSLELFAHFPDTKNIAVVLLIGIAALLIGICIQAFTSARRNQLAYLQARCSAEMLRILVFWELNDIKSEFIDEIAERHFMRLSTVLPLIKLCHEEFKSEAKISVPKHIVAEWTAKHWMVDQLRYFHSAFHRNRIKAEVCKSLSGKLFGWGVAAIVAVFALQAKQAGSLLKGQYLMPIAEGLLAIGPSAIVCAAVVEFYSERRGFEADAQRYEYAHHIFLRSQAGPADAEAGSPEHESDHHARKSEFNLLKFTGSLFAVLALVPLIWLCYIEFTNDSSSRQVWYLAAAGCVAISLLTDVISLMTRPAAEITKDEAIRVEWLTAAMEVHRTSKEHLKSVASEAIQELVDWYISSVDREIALPKG